MRRPRRLHGQRRQRRPHQQLHLGHPDHRPKSLSCLCSGREWKSSTRDPNRARKTDWYPRLVITKRGKADASFRYFGRLKSIPFLAPIYPPDSYPKIFQLKNASRSCLEKVKLQYIDCTQDWVKSIDAVSHIFCYSSSKWSSRKTLEI